jgi:hypothetical protein
MATIEREAAPILRLSSDAPVFAAVGNRRAQRLWALALIAAAVVCLWVVGVGVGVLGFDGLPRPSLPGLDRVVGGGENRDQPGVEKRGTAVTAAAPDQAAARTPRTARSMQAGRVQRVHRARVAVQRSRSRTRPVVVAAPPLQPQPPTTPLRQGWARDGSTVPPGQTRKAEVAPPPPTVPGERGRGREEQMPTTPIAPPPPENHNPKK